jgi:hypothetical protein
MNGEIGEILGKSLGTLAKKRGHGDVDYIGRTSRTNMVGWKLKFVEDL